MLGIYVAFYHRHIKQGEGNCAPKFWAEFVQIWAKFFLKGMWDLAHKTYMLPKSEWSYTPMPSNHIEVLFIGLNVSIKSTSQLQPQPLPPPHLHIPGLLQHFGWGCAIYLVPTVLGTWLGCALWSIKLVLPVKRIFHIPHIFRYPSVYVFTICDCINFDWHTFKQ